MESTTVKLYSLNYGNVRTYLAASLFIVGNILFPQFFHLIPQGGITWLPIYFFTVIELHFSNRKICRGRSYILQIIYIFFQTFKHKITIIIVEQNS